LLIALYRLLYYPSGTLKAKLAKLRSELFLEQSGGGGGGTGEGFDVARNGDARVALIGFPSVGKSSLLNQLTSTESEAAGYGTCWKSSFPFCRCHIVSIVIYHLRFVCP